MKYWVVQRNDDSSIHVIGANKKPRSTEYVLIGESPVADVRAGAYIDVTDGAITVNAQKLAAYEQAQAAKEQAKADKAAQKQAVITQLKATGSDDVKKLIEILGL